MLSGNVILGTLGVIPGDDKAGFGAVAVGAGAVDADVVSAGLDGGVGTFVINLAPDDILLTSLILFILARSETL